MNTLRLFYFVLSLFFLPNFARAGEFVDYMSIGQPTGPLDWAIGLANMLPSTQQVLPSAALFNNTMMASAGVGVLSAAVIAGMAYEQQINNVVKRVGNWVANHSIIAGLTTFSLAACIAQKSGASIGDGFVIGAMGAIGTASGIMLAKILKPQERTFISYVKRTIGRGTALNKESIEKRLPNKYKDNQEVSDIIELILKEDTACQKAGLNDEIYTNQFSGVLTYKNEEDVRNQFTLELRNAAVFHLEQYLLKQKKTSFAS